MKIRLKAGVLSFTLYVSIVVSIMLMSMILYGYYARTETAMYRIGIRLLDNLASAEQWALGNAQDMESGEVKSWDLFGRGVDSVSINKTNWGLFEMYNCKAFYRGFFERSLFMAGDRLDSIGQSAIYLIDDGRPLSVVGETKITGKAYLPLAGVKSAFIDRLGYTGKELIYGSIKKSESKMPKLHAKEAWKAFESGLQEMTSISVNELDKGTLNQKFSSDTVIHLTAPSLELADTITGFVYLEVDSTIVFKKSSYTENIVVAANQIRFEEGFKGSGQFYATGSIIVESDVLLEYPSVFYVYNDRAPALIEIKEKSEVNGVLILDGSESTDRDRVINAEDGTEINGAIYCHGYVEAFGTVHGHVVAKRFLINSFSGIYENYILNATYNYDLDTNFLLPNAWHMAQKRGIVQWLE